VDLSRLRRNQSFSHGEELNADGESGKPRISAVGRPGERRTP
jgi:hypothetical protein